MSATPTLITPSTFVTLPKTLVRDAERVGTLRREEALRLGKTDKCVWQKGGKEPGIIEDFYGAGGEAAWEIATGEIWHPVATLKIDGEDFPWFINSVGVSISVSSQKNPEATVTILAEQVEVSDHLYRKETT